MSGGVSALCWLAAPVAMFYGNLQNLVIRSKSVIKSSSVISSQTDRPKSAHNCCVIEVFGGVFVLSCCFLDFSVGLGAVVIGLRQISSFYSLDTTRGLSNKLSFRFFDPLHNHSSPET